MEFIIVSVIYKSVLRLVLLFQTLQLIVQRPIASIYEETRKKKKKFTNKSPWGIKTHGNMRSQLSPCEQEAPPEGKGEQPMFSPNQKEQLGTYIREPSLWEWTKGCLLNFLSPPPNVNSAQGLSHQLKPKEWWNFIIFPKTAPPAKGELKPNYSNSNKLMLKMLKMFKMWFMCQAHES